MGSRREKCRAKTIVASAFHVVNGLHTKREIQACIMQLGLGEGGLSDAGSQARYLMFLDLVLVVVDFIIDGLLKSLELLVLLL